MRSKTFQFPPLFWIFLAPAGLFLVFVPGMVQGLTSMNVLAVTFYLSSTVFLPGYLICSLLGTLSEEDSIVSWIFASGSVGVAVNVFLVFLLVVLDFTAFVSVAIGVLLLIGLIWLVFREIRNKEAIHFPLSLTGILMVLVGITSGSALVFYLFRDLPSTVNTIPFRPYTDVPWHIGNIAEIARGQGLSDPRVSGTSFLYHIAAHLFLGGITRFCAISSELSLVAVFPLFLVFHLILGAFAITTQFFDPKESRTFGNAAILLSPFIILFSGELDFSSNHEHVFGDWSLSVLSKSPTYAFSLLFLFALVFQVGNAEQKQRCGTASIYYYLLIFLLSAVASLSKISLGCIIFVGFLFSCAVGALCRAPDLVRRLGSTISAFVGFLVVYLLFSSGSGGGDGIAFSFFSYHEILQSFPGYLGITADKGEFGSVLLFLCLYLIGLYHLKWCGLSLLLKGGFQGCFLAGAAFAGLGAQLILRLPSYAEGYFSIYVTFLLGVLTLKFLLTTAESGSRKKKLTCAGIALSLVVVAFFTIGELFAVSSDIRVVGEKPSIYDVRDDLVQLAEVIDEEVPPNAVLLFNGIGSSGTERFFLGSGYLNRRFFLEGWEFRGESQSPKGSLSLEESFPERYELQVKALEQGDEGAVSKLAKEYGANWVVNDLRFFEKIANPELYEREFLVGEYQLLALRDPKK